MIDTGKIDGGSRCGAPAPPRLLERLRDRRDKCGRVTFGGVEYVMTNTGRGVRLVPGEGRDEDAEAVIYVFPQVVHLEAKKYGLRTLEDDWLPRWLERASLIVFGEACAVEDAERFGWHTINLELPTDFVGGLLEPNEFWDGKVCAKEMRRSPTTGEIVDACLTRERRPQHGRGSSEHDKSAWALGPLGGSSKRRQRPLSEHPLEGPRTCAGLDRLGLPRTTPVKRHEDHLHGEGLAADRAETGEVLFDLRSLRAWSDVAQLRRASAHAMMEARHVGPGLGDRSNDPETKMWRDFREQVDADAAVLDPEQIRTARRRARELSIEDQLARTRRGLARYRATEERLEQRAAAGFDAAVEEAHRVAPATREIVEVR